MSDWHHTRTRGSRHGSKCRRSASRACGRATKIRRTPSPGQGKGETDVWGTRGRPRLRRRTAPFVLYPTSPPFPPSAAGKWRVWRRCSACAWRPAARWTDEGRGGTSEPTVTPQPDHLPLRNDPMLTCPCRPLGDRPIHMRGLFIWEAARPRSGILDICTAD